MRRRGWFQSGLLALLGLGAAACTATGGAGPSRQPLVYPPPGFTHHVGSRQLEFFWRCAQPEPSLLRVEGVAVNAWGGEEARYLKMELAGADAQGRYVSSATFESPTPQIGLAESQPFRFDLRTTGTEVRFDLFYDYGFLQEPVSWPLAAAGNVPFHLAQGFKSIVRDACSPTQHLTH